MQPRGVLQEDGAHPLPGKDDQGPRVQAPAPREQREEGPTGRARRTHRPGGRPPAKGRHQLAGDIRAAARPGLRRQPHHGEDLHLGDCGHKGAVHALVALDHVVREEAAGAELRDAQRQRATQATRPLSR